MFYLKYYIVLVLSANVYCDDLNNDLEIENAAVQPNEEDFYLIFDKTYEYQRNKVDQVEVHVYYETYCPYCIDFFVNYLQPIVESMHQYLKLHIYPYGNAKTEKQNNKFIFTCQHGEKECYGNKLHACALDFIKDEKKAALYTCCLMKGKSVDETASECGKSMKIDANPIKECAKGDKGDQLLNYYGDLSHQVSYQGVPYILVNGESSSPEDFKRDICNALSNPPPSCEESGYVLQNIKK